MHELAPSDIGSFILESVLKQNTDFFLVLGKLIHRQTFQMTGNKDVASVKMYTLVFKKTNGMQ